MSNIVVSLLFGIGAGGWIYAKMYRRTGGNRQTAVIVAGLSGLVLFILLLMVLNSIFPPD